MNIWDKFTLLLATGFGLGLIAPFAPGTIGSIPGVALAYAMSTMPLWLQLAAALGLTMLSVAVCDRSEKLLGIKDDGRITADEWMLFPIATLGIPLTETPWWGMVIFFAVVRAIDILKPWPCRGLQKIPGGRGITIDDFVANLYALAVNWVVFSCFF